MVTGTAMDMGTADESIKRVNDFQPACMFEICHMD